METKGRDTTFGCIQFLPITESIAGKERSVGRADVTHASVEICTQHVRNCLLCNQTFFLSTLLTRGETSPMKGRDCTTV